MMFKLKKSNKYMNSIIATTLSALIISGCSSVSAQSYDTETPNPTLINEEVLSTPSVDMSTNVDEVENSQDVEEMQPTPSDLSYWDISGEELAEEVRLLGIKNPKAKKAGSEVYLLIFNEENTDIQKFMFCYITLDVGKKTKYVTDIFSDELLFEYKVKSDAVHKSPAEDNITDITANVPYFDGITDINIELTPWIIDYTGPYRESDTENHWYDIYLEYLPNGSYSTELIHTVKEWGEFYIKMFPQEHRVNIYDLHPELEEEHVKKLS